MEQFQIYSDIQKRTGGEIYIGVVGPVRTGKSTFVRHFMEIMALPGKKPVQQAEIRDQLPLSGSGTIITTVEPKFIPREAVEVLLDGENQVKIRMIDCVGYLIPNVSGHMEDGKERMVHTPWTELPIPFHKAADLGTQKVIKEHATIGLVVTADGSFGEIKREQYLEAEKRAVQEMKTQGKPFLVLLNSSHPYNEETKDLVRSMEETYHVSVLAVNCEQLKKEDIGRILEKILYEFPITEIQFYIPDWMELLPVGHEWKQQLIQVVRETVAQKKQIRDIVRERMELNLPFIESLKAEQIRLSDGAALFRICIKDSFYYKMLSEMSHVPMENQYDLLRAMQEFAGIKEKYVRAQDALEAVYGCGYGVVMPNLSEIQMEEPELIRQGNKFGVKIKSKSPSIHMIRAEIETEIAPIVGTEQQALDLIQYIGKSEERGESIWQTKIFGKSIEQLIQDGIKTKISMITEESQIKLQDTMQKIVNDSKGGMICIII